MRYSDDIIEEVRMKNDIVDVVSQYVKLNKRGSTYFGLCPFHNEKTPSFSVTPAKQRRKQNVGLPFWRSISLQQDISIISCVVRVADRHMNI